MFRSNRALASLDKWPRLQRKNSHVASHLIPCTPKYAESLWKEKVTNQSFYYSGVAVGSSIGHAIGGLFGGGSSSVPAESQQGDSSVVSSSTNGASSQSNDWGPRSCESDARSFTRCLDENAGNMQICGWYLDQLVSYKYGSQISLRLTYALRKRASLQRASIRLMLSET